MDGTSTDGAGVDVIVLGAGPAGENVAGRCARAGLAVAIVERELVGGECSYWGCIPSKTLLRPGEVLAAARRVPGAAAAVTGQLDVAAVLARRDELVSDYHDDGQVPWLTERGVELVRGTGRLTGRPREVRVSLADGGQRLLVASRAVVLATGTRATIPPVPGLAEAEPWDNRSATGARHVPRSLVVLGGGAVGAELAQAFRRLGSESVTVVEGAPRLLAREEEFVGDEVRAAFEAEGITVLVDTRATAVHRPPAHRVDQRRPQVSVQVTGPAGVVRELVVDEILVAAGRTPATDDLGLETIGSRPGGFVEVDEHLRARAVPEGWLYAVGDVCGRALLTHMGKYQARIAADVIVGRHDSVGRPARDHSDGRAVPRVTFTDPQVAAVGLTERAAREAGLAVRTVRVPTGGVAGASVRGTGAVGTSMLVIEEDRRVVVGATFTGADTQELLHAATIAIVGEVSLDRLWHAVPAFPTVSEVWLRRNWSGSALIFG